MSDMGWKMDDLPAQPTCGYCRDCRWWEHQETDGNYGECQKVHNQGSKFAAFCCCGTDATFGLETDADFGCIQWEGKDDTR